jgi:O-antigen ligase
MWSKLFVVWLSLLPFVVWPGTFEGAKVIWFLTGGFFLTAFWLIKLKDKLPKVLTRSDFWYFSWLVVLSISSIFGVHPVESILGGSYRHQGVLFFFTLWLVGKTVRLLPRKDKKLLVGGLGASVIIEAIVIFSQFFLETKGSFLSVDGRPLGTFGEPNAVAGFLAIGSSFLTQFTLFLPVFLALLATTSRTGIASFLILAIGLLVVERKKLLAWPAQKKIYVALLFLVILVFSPVAIKKISLIRQPSLFESRSTYWKLGWQKVWERPVLGFGAESGEAFYEDAFKKVSLPLFDLIVDRSHNLFLDVIIWSGFVGLIFFLGFMATAFYALASKKKRINLIGSLVWLFFSLFQPLGVAHWLLLHLLFNL